jgi:ribose 5-phosphate isomerase
MIMELKIEQLLCFGDTKDEIVAKLNVPIELVNSVWDSIMRDFADYIANPPPRMSDAEYDQMVSDMHGLDFENGE